MAVGRGDMDYKEAYEQEHIKNAELAGRIADLEAGNEELQFKLDRIKTIRSGKSASRCAA